MKNLKKVALTLALAAVTGSVFAANVDNWRNGTNELTWKNGTNELCWRNATWTPATAAPGCDGALAAPAAAPAPAAPAPAPAAAPAAAPAPAAPAAAPAPAPAPAKQAEPQKVTYAADAFFDFDKSVLKPEGKAKLDDLASKIKGIKLEVVIATGHTDSIGSNAYNDRLSVRRAEAVKAYLVSKGIDSSRVYTEGKGETQPVADNRTAEGRAQNRRVVIEVVGTK
jgi:OOP family OmpA-OmpF porin